MVLFPQDKLMSCATLSKKGRATIQERKAKTREKKKIEVKRLREI